MPIAVAGQLVLQTLYLSLDPYMRGRMNDAPSYAPPVAIGEPMVGATISRVWSSQNPSYDEGDLVLSASGWQDFSLSDGSGLMKLDPHLVHPTVRLGVMGMTGFTAYVGLLTIGKPQTGETVVVAAASGAVGSVVGQIAKIKGCRVVGIAGGTDKCREVVDELGFDVCLDRHEGNLAGRLADACTRGIDIYFENVGGPVFDAVLPLLNLHARVPLCGLISHYNDTGASKGPDRLPLLVGTLLGKRIKMQGFIVGDEYVNRYDEFLGQMGAWFREGKVKVREEIVDDLENAPTAFIGLLAGKNRGKLIIRVSND